MSDRQGRLVSQREVALVDIVDRVLNAGVVIGGDITLSLADIDLVYMNLRLLVASVPTIRGEFAEELDCGRRELVAPGAQTAAKGAP